MKSIIVIFLFCFTLPLFSNNTNHFDTSIKRFNYIKIKRDHLRHYPSHIQYCKYVLYDPGGYFNIRIKKLNKILNGIDTIYHLNISYFKGFKSCSEIPTLRRVKSAVVTYKTINDIDIFSLKNIKELSIVSIDQKRLFVNQINNDLSYLSTSNPLDSTLSNLTNLDSLFWKPAQIDSVSGQYIATHSKIKILKIGLENRFFSKEEVRKTINILGQSKSIRKIEIYNWQFEDGAVLILEKFCKSNNIILVLPTKYIENSFN